MKKHAGQNRKTVANWVERLFKVRVFTNNMVDEQQEDREKRRERNYLFDHHRVTFFRLMLFSIV